MLLIFVTFIINTTDAHASYNPNWTATDHNETITGTWTFNNTISGSISGSAATWTTARTLAGNSVNGSANVAFANKFIVQGTADAGLSSAQFLGALASGILYNTTTTGVIGIATTSQFPTLNQNTTGSAATATTATNATNITTTDDTATNATYYPTFQTATGGTNPLKTSSSKLTFNPSTGTLTATAFSGTTTATNVTNTEITNDTATNAVMYPTWVTANSGNLPQKVSSTKLTFNPSSGSVGIGYTAPTNTALAVSGNVGVGLSVTQAKLDILDGDIRLSDTASANADGSKMYYYNGDGNYWRMYTGGDETFNFSYNGGAGLKMNSTDMNFGSTNAILFRSNSNSSSQVSGLRTDTSNNLYVESPLNVYLKPDSDNNGSQKTAFLDGAGTELVSIWETGNMGIGYTAADPGAKLAVWGNLAIGYSTSAQALVVNGNVGIGRTNPVAPLNIYDTALANGVLIQLQSTTAAGYTQMAFTGNTKQYQIGVGNSGAGLGLPSKFFIYDGTANVVRLVVDTNGNVGIAKTAPVYTVDVGGDVNISSTGSYRYNTSCVAGSCASDIRLKKDIKPLDPSLNKLLHLTPSTFKFKEQKYGPTDIDSYGLIAQEVEKVYPEWVTTDDKGYKHINYGFNLTMNILKAIQEQQAEIDDQKNKLITQQNKIEMLRKEMCTKDKTFSWCGFK
ncbi:MAG: tail fiber domain-containing protein [Candidatus Omnitrophica bacterium]|nr:tail fiber domain-containing protein [Candidatus Omnitrophota bacterium]